MFKFVDLFAGIGGFHSALSNNGGKCVGFSEVNKDAIDTYCKNYNIDKSLNLGDITKIKDLPEHDILTAGVPCQSWSIAGKNLGFEDDRGQLWNDTIYLLQKSKPKAFIFENVKGLVDPRNKKAFDYIMNRIEEAGYTATYHIVNSLDYGVLQNRIRVYIVGFREDIKFKFPEPIKQHNRLGDIINIDYIHNNEADNDAVSLSSTNGVNDYFLFNDLRNGDTTIHSWDIIETTQKEKEICMLLLKNRRKKRFGLLDGNPLSLEHFQTLNSSITQSDLDKLVKLDIFKEVDYRFKVINKKEFSFQEEFTLDELKTSVDFKHIRHSINKVIKTHLENGDLISLEKRYDFKNSKISTGLFGINRIFLPSAKTFSTLVASDTNDYISLVDIPRDQNYKQNFLKEVFHKKNYRKLTKEETCLLQGFPIDFDLPESRNRWMKLLGNSVSVPVIDILVKEIVKNIK